MEPHSIALKGGNLYYVEKGRRSENTKTVILVHGWPDSWRSWQTTIPHLCCYQSASSPLHLIAIDLIGFGSSKQGTEQTLFEEDILEFLDKLQIQKVTLIGHSLGSMIVR
jgi:pimeloyl-ACP methyl ester carboxylesterase